MKTLAEVKSEMLATALGKPLSAFSLRNAAGRIVVESNSQTQYAFTNAEDEAYAQANYTLSERFTNSEGKTINYWKLELSEKGLFKSADGSYYSRHDLPENDDDFVTSKYADIVRAERNARISDTDDYVKLPDITVQNSVNSKRSALSEEDRTDLVKYREGLRNMPESSGFPFVEFPTFPGALAYELEKKINVRKLLDRVGGRYA